MGETRPLRDPLNLGTHHFACVGLDHLRVVFFFDLILQDLLHRAHELGLILTIYHAGILIFESLAGALLFL